MVYDNKKECIDLDRIGCVWGIVEALVNLMVMAYFLCNSDGLVIKVLTLVIDFREHVMNLLILKMFSSILLALGSALVSGLISFNTHSNRKSLV